MTMPEPGVGNIIQKEQGMTSWIMWEIWWSRMWGEDARALSHDEQEEVAYEPSRLPAELIAQGKPVRSHPPRPRG